MVGLEPFRVAHHESCEVRWLLLPCLNSLCRIRRHRHGIVSVDGGPWVVGLYPTDHDDVEDCEAAMLEDLDVVVRQALAFGVDEWERVTAKEVHSQMVTVETLGQEGVEYLLDCPLADLVTLRAFCQRGAMAPALECLGRFGFNEGGNDGSEGSGW